MNWNRRLAQARTAKGIKKSELAKLIGVSAPTVTQWENGTIARINGINLHRVCECLSVSTEWLLTDPDPVDLPTELARAYLASDTRGRQTIIAFAVSMAEDWPMSAEKGNS